MPRALAYRFLDLGAEQRLEAIGDLRLIRPAAGFAAPPRNPELWDAWDARFDRSRQAWELRRPLAEFERVFSHGAQHFQLHLSESAQIGFFPVQAPVRAWLTRIGARLPQGRVLSLFGYTGGAAHAAALAGLRPAHVDASASVVERARRNALLSGAAADSVRWICDDARKFTAREIKRGRVYEGVCLDPPSFGRGPGGATWKFERDIEPLLAQCVELCQGGPRFMLLSAHTPGFDGPRLQELLASRLTVTGVFRQAPLNLTAESGAVWRGGHMALFLDAALAKALEEAP